LFTLSVFSKGSRFYNPNPLSQMLDSLFNVTGVCLDPVGCETSLACYSTVKDAARQTVHFPVESDACTSKR
jgi:hypothetical protein